MGETAVLGDGTPGVRSDRSGAQLRLTLTNPRTRNSITLPMFESLTRALRDVSDEVGVVVLTGEGSDAFSSGADLGGMTGADGIALMREAVSAAAAAVEQCPVPVIARIGGACIGAAVELVLTADLRACSANAKFRLPAARLGVDYPIEGLARYVDAIGLAATSRVALLGEEIDATQAAEWGLVHAAAGDSADLDALVDGWSERLLAGNVDALRGMRASLGELRLQGQVGRWRRTSRVA
jgi:enoyl-CoA hydratase/carnithine racemase